jgi:hypothetical protein
MDKVTHMASVELWVLMTTVLLVVRFVIDFFGPWYSNKYTLATVQIIELLNYNMVHYTLGLMQLSAARVNDYFQVWGVLMVTLQYSVKVGRPYGRSKRIPLMDLMSSFWTGNLLRVQTVMLLKIPLWFIWSVNAARIIAYFLFSDNAHTCNEENARLVCDYMRYEHTLSETSNTESMSGYKYLVSGEDQQEMKLEPGKSSLVLDVKHEKLITVEKIWGLHDSRLLSGTADSANRLKDVCLSYALYKLLRRRFYDLPIHEAGQEKTKKLVLDGILKDGGSDYERVFRITGVELSFLQDLFHSKHAQMFAGGFPFRSMLLLSLSLVAATGYIAVYPVGHIPQKKDPKDPSGITHGVSTTRFIVFLIIFKEMLEILMYLFSQWTKVLMICKHVNGSRWWRSCLAEKGMRIMFKLIRKGKWNQNIRQYNLLISSRPLKIFVARLFPTSIKLETEVTKAILESFKGLGRIAATPQTSEGLQQQHPPETSVSYLLDAFASKPTADLKWAIDLEADTHRILVWHIATCLCEIILSDEATALKTFWLKPTPFVKRSRTPENVWKHYVTASSLSNYCAYLVTRGLVPDNGLVVGKVFLEVRREMNRATFKPWRLKSLFDMYDELMENAKKKTKADVQSGDRKEESDELPEAELAAMGVDSTIITEEMHGPDDEEDDGTADVVEVNEEDPERGPEDCIDNEDTITKMGTRLGDQLMETYGTNTVGLWEDLAKFWTGFLLHLAARTSAAKHRGHLAGSGELITHLWALLSHAGFLGSSHGEQNLDPEDVGRQDETNRHMISDPRQTQTFVR